MADTDSSGRPDGTDEEDQDVLIGEEPGASVHPMLATEDSYEELDYDLSIEAPTEDQRRERLASGTIASIVEEHTGSGSVEEVATEATELENDVGGRRAEGNTSNLQTAEDATQHRTDTVAERKDVPNDTNEEVRQTREAEQREIADEDIHSSVWRDHKKHVFILSEAGKPIYSRYGNEDKLVSLMGVMQALVSFVQDGKNVLRSIVAGGRMFVFLVRQPLILVAVSRTYESQQQLLMQLTYVYNQVLSVLTYSQLSRVLETRKNYDLRRLLAGTEKFLDNLLNLIDQDPSFLLTAVRCLPLDSATRDTIGHSIQSAKIKDLVFAILIADNQLVTLCRMKKYILHPSDLHLVFNLLNASTSFQAADSWIPICLPKFDSDGFLHAHISYLDNSKACLLLLTVDKMMFFELAKCKDKIVDKLKKHNCLEAINKAVAGGGYRCQEVGISDLRHFIYKSKSTAQFTAPELEAPYRDPEERARLFTIYQYVHQRVHNAARPLKIMFHVGSREAMLGWVTTGFELYAVFGPLATKQVAILAVNKLLKWIKKEEYRLFILDPPEY
ncbi:protein SAND-like isoform X2 [Acanthaster planci]|uniref:Vacuolar fusion protein MON1 homolog n=1 Tax=Acanthaster planci TaxID=133434 RepID=A0A8B7XXB3_ACAPL|nr:protein SAND-like isoform X2 [Acanthaster planci]